MRIISKGNRATLPAKDVSVSAYVYVLRSDDGERTYVGWTVDLDRRLARHNSGAGAKFTRGRFWRLIYAERHATREDAMAREWALKRDRKFRAALKS
jgi:putative endonuclease